MRWLLLTCFCLVVETAPVFPPTPPGVTAFQRALVESIRAPAKAMSQQAEVQLLQIFASTEWHDELQRLGDTELGRRSPTDLLQQLKDALSTVEFATSFGESTPENPGMSCPNISTIDYWGGWYPNDWQLRYFNSSLEANVTDSFFTIYDNAERMLYQLKPFSEASIASFDPTWDETAERPTYCSINNRRIDTGASAFGQYQMIFRGSVVADRALIIAGDSGIFEGQCNSSMNNSNTSELIQTPAGPPGPYPPPPPHGPIPSGPPFWPNHGGAYGPHGGQQYGPFAAGYQCAAMGGLGWNTSDWRAFPALQGAELHTIVNHCQLNGAPTTRLLGQLLSQKAEVEPVEKWLYTEAAILGGARTQDLKDLVVSFDVFGTSAGEEVVKFCEKYSLPLLWALGTGVNPNATNSSKYPTYNYPVPFGRPNTPAGAARILDIHTVAYTKGMVEPSQDQRANWQVVQDEIQMFKKTGQETEREQMQQWFAKLAAAANTSVWPLRGAECGAATDLCFGTNQTGSCVCRTDPDALPDVIVV